MRNIFSILDSENSSENKNRLEKVDNSRRKFIEQIGLLVLGSSLPDLGVAKSKETKKKVSLDNLLPEISEIINSYYKNDETNMDQSIELTGKLADEIVKFLEKKGINLGKSNDTNQIKLIKFFDSKGYIFAITPIEISKDKYLVNAPLYKKGNVVQYDLSNLKFKDFPKVEGKVPVVDVEEVLIPDIREYKGNVIFDGITIGNSLNGESKIVILLDNLKKITKEGGLNEKDYKDTVVINEASQVYFSKIFPNVILGNSLSETGIDTYGHDWKFLHMQEAFSDLASLKYGKTFKNELIRIIRTDSYYYDFSRSIAIASTNLGFKNLNSPIKVNKENAESIINNLEGENLSTIKEIVIGSYEANLSMIIQQILRMSSTKK